MMRKRNRAFWRFSHKWIGLIFAVFILLFCFSGIILNHRKFFSFASVSRTWLPKVYKIEDWNQGVVKGTLRLQDGRILAFGQAGVWETGPMMEYRKDWSTGLKKGEDNRKISSLVQAGDGSIWCTGLYDLYRFSEETGKWAKIELEGNHERLSDLCLKGRDSLVVLSRSIAYQAVAPEYDFKAITLNVPGEYDNRVTLFKTFWMVHSGQLFGIVGQLFVDLIAIVLIILCITGIIFFILGKSIRRRGKGEQADMLRRKATGMKNSLKWHNTLGSWTIIFTLIIALTGMCLRPPLMIPLAMTKTPPVPGSVLASENVFRDKLRSLRWDDDRSFWLLSTSEGFYSIKGDLDTAIPEAIHKVPSVSPMGINVFAKNPSDSSEWVVGSFGGLFSWNPDTGSVTDWFTGQRPQRGSYGAPAEHAVSGWSEDVAPSPVVFDYYSGASQEIAAMPEVISSLRMSLWNFALELHVGRCYEPFLGSVLSVLFVFLSGLLLSIVLISGYILYRKTHKHSKQSQS